MEDAQPEADVIQVGKRRSSLGALSKSKPVTKLKSMFEAKGVAPKPKDSGLLGKLKPISVSHDTSSFNAAIAASLGVPASQTISFPTAADQPPATPTQPLFNVLAPPPEPEAVPQASPPISMEDGMTSPLQYNESLCDGSEADARSSKSPGSAGFLKRMGSSLKKALTPKSSSGKQKRPSYAGSETSNISPRPSGVLALTPHSLPSCTSLDLNCRSDQMQSAPPQSPNVSLGYEVHSAREEQDWASERVRDGNSDVPSSRAAAGLGRPPLSPRLSPATSGFPMETVTPRPIASPNEMGSIDVPLSVSPDGSPDQAQSDGGPSTTTLPMAPEDSFMSAEGTPADGDNSRPASATGAANSFDTSLTASPTGCNVEDDIKSPVQEVDMCTSVFSEPPPFPVLASEVQSVSDGPASGPTEDLVFPKLAAGPSSPPSLELPATGQEPCPTEAAGSSSPVQADTSQPMDADMEPRVETAWGVEQSNAPAVASATISEASEAAWPATSGMDIDMVEAPLSSQSSRPGSVRNGTEGPERQSFGAAIGMLDLSGAVASPEHAQSSGSPRSPDATTPTNFGSEGNDTCIIGLTPIRPDTTAMKTPVDTPALSTVAEGSPEAPSTSRSPSGDVPMYNDEQRCVEVEADPHRAASETAHCSPVPSHQVTSEAHQCGAAASKAPSSQATTEDMDWDGDNSGQAAEADTIAPSVIQQQDDKPKAHVVSSPSPTALATSSRPSESASAMEGNLPVEACASSPQPASEAPVSVRSDNLVETKAANITTSSYTSPASTKQSPGSPAARSASLEESFDVPSAVVTPVANSGRAEALRESDPTSTSVQAHQSVPSAASQPLLLAEEESKEQEPPASPVVAGRPESPQAAWGSPVPDLRSDAPVTLKVDEAVGEREAPASALVAGNEAVMTGVPKAAASSDEAILANGDTGPEDPPAPPLLRSAPELPTHIGAASDVDMEDAPLVVEGAGANAATSASGAPPLVPPAVEGCEAPIDALDRADMPSPMGFTLEAANRVVSALGADVEPMQPEASQVDPSEPEPADLPDPVPSSDGTAVLAAVAQEVPQSPSMAQTVTHDDAAVAAEAVGVLEAGQQTLLPPADAPDGQPPQDFLTALEPPLGATADSNPAGIEMSQTVVTDVLHVGASAMDEAPAAQLVAVMPTAAPEATADESCGMGGAKLPADEQVAEQDGPLAAGSGGAVNVEGMDVDTASVSAAAAPVQPSDTESLASKAEVGAPAGVASRGSPPCQADNLCGVDSTSSSDQAEPAVPEGTQEAYHPAATVQDATPGSEAEDGTSCKLDACATASGVAADDPASKLQLDMDCDLVAFGSTHCDTRRSTSAHVGAAISAAGAAALESCQSQPQASAPSPPPSAVSNASVQHPVDSPSNVPVAELAPSSTSGRQRPTQSSPICQDAAAFDDPMMVSPMPPRFSAKPTPLRLASDPSVPPASPDNGAAFTPASVRSTGTPGMLTPISPETAHVGVRAFKLDDIDEPEAAQEPPAEVIPAAASSSNVELGPGPVSTATASVTEVPVDRAPSTRDPGMISLEPQTLIPEEPGPAASTEETAVAMLSPVVPKTRPSVTFTSPVKSPPRAVEVAMADSLETIEAMWGNDDLLAEAGADEGSFGPPLPLPQAASSPVSAAKLAGVMGGPGSSRKVAPDVVLQVQRESLDLFSLRNSCAGRVSDSLMVESLDSFEGASLCAKSRAVGFVPMAPLNEANEQEAEEDAGSPVAVASFGGAEVPVATAPASRPTANLTFTPLRRGSPLPEGMPTPVLQPPGTSSSSTPSANRPAASSDAGGSHTPAGTACQSKGAVSAMKTVTPSGAIRTNSAPSTALKALAASNALCTSVGKPTSAKRPSPLPPAHGKPTTGPAAAGACPTTSVGRAPLCAMTPGAGVARVTPVAKPFMPSPLVAGGAPAGRAGLTPRGTLVPTSVAPASARTALQGRTGTGAGLFDTPLILRAAAVPLADSPFTGCDFDLDTVDISAEASRAIAMLGAGDANDAAAGGSATTAQQATPVLAGPMRAAGSAATPTISVMETHVHLLTNKLAETEALLFKKQEENAMLRDQLSTLQFENSMTNDLDMEREARQFLEQELAVVRHRNDSVEAELRSATEQLAASQAKETEWAQENAQLLQNMQQMQSERDSAVSSQQQAQAAASAALAKCEEESARYREMQGTLGLQAHQLVQVQRARDEAEAKFQKAMEQLIAAQTTHKKQVVEYEQKIQQQNAIMAQFVELRDRYRQVKQLAADTEQRAQRAEAKAQEAATELASAKVEKSELLRMCNELLTQLEATKGKDGR